MSKHTPGSDVAVGEGYGGELMTACPTCGCEMYSETGPCAGKDLLEAALLAVSVLGHMAVVLGWTPEEGTVIPQLRAAIAKAERR